MPATQISFLAFAQAAQQQATVCTPPVTQAPAALVVQPDVADGGECTVAELWDAACAICEFHVSAHRPVTDSYMFLMNQFYARGGFTDSLTNTERVQHFDSMVMYAHRCIQAGC